MRPSTKYVKCGDLHIAYRVIGDGPLDLVYVPGWVSHVELMWEEPLQARMLERMASFSRLITFDKRGTGLSDPVPSSQLPTLEERMDDLRCVLDAVKSKSAAFFGFSEGSNLSALYAATYPERTRALVLFGTFAKRIWSPDYPWAPKPAQRNAEYEYLEKHWGGEMDLSEYVPSMMHDQDYIRRLSTYFRRSASPTAAVTLLKMNTGIDIRDILPVIQVPTLVIHRRGDREAHVDEGRWVADRIPGAKFLELEGEDHLPWVGDQETMLDEVEVFLTGTRQHSDFDRVLSTILFTDIVGSTKMAVSVGDDNFRRLIRDHNATVRQQILAHSGQEIDTTGDGFLVIFDGPARAVKCGHQIIQGLKSLGINVRVGIHTGQIHKVGKEVSGLSVHIASRILSHAGADEVLVSQVVKDLTSGSDITYERRGNFELRGVPGEWVLYNSKV